MWPIVKIILAAILSILEELGSPGSTPAASDDPMLAPGTQATAGVFDLLRTIDPCAMHDVVAAAIVTGGDRPDQIVPTTSLGTCQLRLHDGANKPTWTFIVEVGVTLPLAHRQESTVDRIDGRLLYRISDTGLHVRSCRYTRPVGSDHGISMTTVAPPGAADTEACAMVRAYLVAGRSLSELILRAEQRTQPRLTLASADPCASAAPVLASLGVQGSAYPQALYECRIQPRPASPSAAITPPVMIGFGFGADPTEGSGADADYQPIIVEGHRGVVATAGSEQPCVVTVAYDTDNAVVQVDRTRWVQTISVHTESCERAKALADVVVHAVSTR